MTYIINCLLQVYFVREWKSESYCISCPVKDLVSVGLHAHVFKLPVWKLSGVSMVPPTPSFPIPPFSVVRVMSIHNMDIIFILSKVSNEERDFRTRTSYRTFGFHCGYLGRSKVKHYRLIGWFVIPCTDGSVDEICGPVRGDAMTFRYVSEHMILGLDSLADCVQ